MMEHISKSAELISPHSEQLGRLVFKCVCSIYTVVLLLFIIYSTMFLLDEQLFKRFPYYENEERTRAYHQDYTGSYTDLPLNHWAVLFREVFYVQVSDIM